MKRLFISLVLALPVFVSCLIDDSDVNYIDARDLTKYTKNKIAESVAIPVEAVELALALDEYIIKTEEEQAKDSLLAGNVKKVSDNEYVVRINSEAEYRFLNCRIKTDGRSIREKDAQWTVRELSMNGNDFALSNYDYYYELRDDAVLHAVAPDEGYWSVDRGGDTVLMILSSLDDGFHTWDVVVAAAEETNVGVKSYYGTSGKFTLQEVLIDSGEKTNAYTGKFFVEIYRNDETIVDYCYATFDGTSASNYKTSR